MVFYYYLFPDASNNPSGDEESADVLVRSEASGLLGCFDDFEVS